MEPCMNILLLNPNTTEAITERLVAAASHVAGGGTRIVPATAPYGVPYISSRAEAQIAGAIVLEMLAERQGAFDAAIIAAFGDPGLMAARELYDAPVIGMSEAAMLTACMLGKRFGIVTFAAAMGPWYEECVDMHGLAGRCAGVRCLDGSFTSIVDVQAEKEEALVSLARRSVEQDGADVVILAGAPLAGLAAVMADRVPVPLVDQAQAALRQAETLALLKVRKASAGRYRRPAPKSSTGLSPALARRLGHTD
jgi:Asp/Glu/hydantoin racemase